MVTILGIEIQEFSVAASDFLLFLESLLLAWMLCRRSPQDLHLKNVKGSGFWLFLCLGIPSLLGAVFHAFFSDAPEAAGSKAVWLLTAASIGFVATTLWYTIAGILGGDRVSRHAHAFALLFLVAYLGTIFFVDSEYRTVIKFYAPPILLLGAIGFWKLFTRPGWHWFYLCAGLSLSVCAALVQTLHVSLDPVYFNFNTLYHLLQGLALPFLFLFYRDFPGERPGP